MTLRLITLILSSLLLLTSDNLVAMDAGKVSPSLSERALPAAEWVNVVAIIRANSIQTPAISSFLMKNSRNDKGHAALISMLKKQDVSNSKFVNRLRNLEASGLAANIKTYWIANAVSFSVEASQLDQLTTADDLEYLLDDQPLELVEPVGQESSESGYAGSSSYMSQIGVRELWDMGYTGHGRLVCSFDTGVEGAHPALFANWMGNAAPAAQGWFDPYGTTAPVDLNGHGTHTMGLMVGRDGGDTVGVAFNAQWMSASVIDRGQSLNKTVSDIIAAFEWAADPDGNPETVSDLPDVICNSWGIPKGLLAPCDQTFWQAIDNLEALGVVVIFACGNEGPNAGTIRNPADRAAGPINSFSIGAVDQNRSDLLVASFSSRGPANCDATRIKPELVAPGVSLRSTYRGGGYRQMSGTSMAAPVVAGCIALMREYNPDATVAEIKDALMMSATDLGP
ncbi:MAG: S8 family serine peptidase, partial [Candidatus Zixiibacteriota bacterium]